MALAILIYFLAGLFLTLGDREPYPAITMPGFRGPGVTDTGEVVFPTVETTVRFADGSSAAISTHALLAPFPGSFHETLLRQLVLLRDGDNPPGRTRLGRILPGWHDRQLRRSRPANDPTITIWLKKGAEQRFPAREPTALDVRWFGNVVHPWKNEPHRKELWGEFTIELQ